jgi:hypothetical protein
MSRSMGAMEEQTRECLGPCFVLLLLFAASAGGCATVPPVGAPFNARAAQALVVGQTSDKEALASLGAPYTASPSTDGANACAKGSNRMSAETWRYLYRDKHNNCVAVLSFDEAGQLCSLAATTIVPGQLCLVAAP